MFFVTTGFIMEEFIMYNEIFDQINLAAKKRNLRDSTIRTYCNSVAHFLTRTQKDPASLTFDDVDIFLTKKDFPAFLRQHIIIIMPGSAFITKKS